MGFLPPTTIRGVLGRIQKLEYVLPAIQREFVWNDDQIYAIFDSLMRGYPIGSFLFWKVEPATHRDYVFYGFIRDYHERDARHCPRLDVSPTIPVTAILDGQQRLTALNIGFRGSLAAKLPNKQWKSLDAFPVKELYLNLLDKADENEWGMEYNLRFLTPAAAKTGGSTSSHWFRVKDILEMDAGPGIFQYLVDNGLGTNKEAFTTLWRLHAILNTELTINAYEEDQQDIDRVLDIFVRVNSGGTVLSHSDLLLSIASAQWDDIDAREVVIGLVDEINEYGQGFAFSKDIVLKSGLVLTDIGDIAFKVTNFNAANMRTLEENWELIARAIRVAARLLADYGFSARNLRADSVLIPIAYYVFKRNVDAGFLTQHQYQEDRATIRQWVIRSLLKTGIWGSGLDTLLGALRGAIRDHGQERFPSAEIESAMARGGKSLRFEPEELDELAETAYGRPNAFSILSLLYRGLDFRNEFHVDHVFPRKQFTNAALRRANISADLIDEYQSRVDHLPNLQLLDGPLNESKSGSAPQEWLAKQFPDVAAQNLYLSGHHMLNLPLTFDGFLDFYESRKSRIVARLAEILG